MSARTRLVLLASTLMSAATLAACARENVQLLTQNVSCSDEIPPSERRHADMLPTKLLWRDPTNTLRITGSAVIVPLKGARNLDDRDFVRGQAVAILYLSSPQGKLPTNHYCMKATLLDASHPDLPASWQVGFHAWNTAAKSYDATALVTEQLLHYWVENEDPTDKVRPSARIMWYRPGATLVGDPGALLAKPDSVVPVPLDEDGEYAAWYRCGSGCCGASLNFS